MSHSLPLENKSKGRYIQKKAKNNYNLGWHPHIFKFKKSIVSILFLEYMSFTNLVQYCIVAYMLASFSWLNVIIRIISDLNDLINLILFLIL